MAPYKASAGPCGLKLSPTLHRDVFFSQPFFESAPSSDSFF